MYTGKVVQVCWVCVVNGFVNECVFTSYFFKNMEKGLVIYIYYVLNLFRHSLTGRMIMAENIKIPQENKWK